MDGGVNLGRQTCSAFTSAPFLPSFLRKCTGQVRLSAHLAFPFSIRSVPITRRRKFFAAQRERGRPHTHTQKEHAHPGRGKGERWVRQNKRILEKLWLRSRLSQDKRESRESGKNLETQTTRPGLTESDSEGNKQIATTSAALPNPPYARTTAYTVFTQKGLSRAISDVGPTATLLPMPEEQP
jgi:hypothetical protein